MAVTLMCPNLRCRRILAVPETCRGQLVRCSYCKTVLAVPFAYMKGSGKASVIQRSDVKSNEPFEQAELREKNQQKET